MTDLKNTWVLGEQYAHTDQNAVGTAVNALTHARPTSGLFSALPSPGNAGATYKCIDVGLLLIDNGTSWDRYGGELDHFFAAPSSGLTTTTLGTSTFTSDKDARLLTCPSAGSSYNWRVEYATLSPTSNYTATAYIETAYAGGLYFDSGIVLLDGSLKMINFGISNNVAAGNLQLEVYYWTSATAVSATPFRVPLGTLVSYPNWTRIRDDGTNRNFEYSYNGIDWITGLSTSRTDFLTASAIGWGASNWTGSTLKLRLRSFNITSP